MRSAVKGDRISPHRSVMAGTRRGVPGPSHVIRSTSHGFAPASLPASRASLRSRAISIVALFIAVPSIIHLASRNRCGSDTILPRSSISMVDAPTSYRGSTTRLDPARRRPRPPRRRRSPEAVRGSTRNPSRPGALPWASASTYPGFPRSPEVPPIAEVAPSSPILLRASPMSSPITRADGRRHDMG